MAKPKRKKKRFYNSAKARLERLVKKLKKNPEVDNPWALANYLTK